MGGVRVDVGGIVGVVVVVVVWGVKREEVEGANNPLAPGINNLVLPNKAIDGLLKFHKK